MSFVVLTAVLSVIVGWVVKNMQRDARWRATNFLRGSKPKLVPQLPPGVERAPRVRIADLKAGDRVVVVGKVVGAAQRIAPISRRLCMASDLAIFDRVKGNLVTRVLQASAFEVDDGSGRITVDGRGAYVRLAYDHSRDGVERAELDEELRARVPEMLWLDVHEGALLPEARVLVIGEVQALPDDGGAGYRRNAPPRLRIAGGREVPAVISAAPDDLAPFD